MGGRSKRKIGRIHKNSEKKRQALKMNKRGRPRKVRVTKSHIEDLNKFDAVISPLLSNNWSKQSHDDYTEYVKLSPQSAKGCVVVTHSLRVYKDLTWSVFIHGMEVDTSICVPLKCINDKLNEEEIVKKMFHILTAVNVCPGHPDQHFIEFINYKNGRIVSKDNSTAAFLDKSASVVLNGETYSQTIRSSSCELLTHGTKCSSCTAYRDPLRVLYNRWIKKKSRSPSKQTDPSSHTPFSNLSTPERKQRFSQVRAKLKASQSKIKRLQEKIKESTTAQGITVDNDLHHDLKQIMNDSNQKVLEEYGEDSFQCLFWKEQFNALKKRGPTAMRWHPMMIRWCLHIKFLSSAAYNAIRSAGFISLPSERTLRDYTRWIKGDTGCQPQVTQMLLDEISKSNLDEDAKKHMCLCMDEVKIKEGLVYDKHECKLIGYTDIGDINNSLLAFERSILENQSPQVAKHMLVLMVRGIIVPVEFPYAQYATSDAAADILFPIVWDAIRHLEFAGLQVHAIVADGASPNRRFFRMHRTKAGEITYRVKNPYSSDNRYLYFISDPPHLMKTTRNCWSNSFGHSNKRALWINGQHISWTHLQQVYNNNTSSSNHGLKLIPKLKREHVSLNSYSRMRVDLAVQVLSSSVASAMQYYGDDQMKETIRFVTIFDKFFDCLNTRHPREGYVKRKPDLNPYKSPTDKRLKWLEDSVLGYLREWKDSVDKRQNTPKFTEAQKKLMMLSDATREGIHITVKSFVEVTKHLLKQPGVKYVLSERFCQDPLESFFGRQRSAGGRNSNPTVKQFIDNTVSLRVQGSAALAQIRGNCRKRPLEKNTKVDNTPLPKRRRHQK